MAHLVALQPPDPELPVFFNVDAPVGAPPAQNKREDVLLVQFAFKVNADTAGPKAPPSLIAAAKAVRVTGMIDQETITAIRVLQEELKKGRKETVVDGRVSPARGAYGFGGALWVIVVLNNSLQNSFVDIWPRIDKIPGCPAELKQMVIRQVAGK
jgi:hypothetical protein